MIAQPFPNRPRARPRLRRTQAAITLSLLASLASCESRAQKSQQRSPVASLAEDSAQSSATPTPVSDDAALPSEAKPTTQDPNQLVDISELLPGLHLDMRYAGKNNFVGAVIYPKSRCLLRIAVAEALTLAQEALAKEDLQLLIWDCYRPFAVQERFWKLEPDARYVAKPVRKDGKPFKGSKHNRGAAVDLSLLTLKGEPVTMPTDHDDFSTKAHVDAPDTSKIAADNARKLRSAMEAAGFTGIPTEWWHFDHKSWRQYDLSDQPL